MTPVADRVLTTLSLYGRLLPTMLSSITASHPGCENGHEVNATIMALIDAGEIHVDGAFLVHVERHEEIPADYLLAADNLRKARAVKSSLWSRLRSRLWQIRDRWLPGLALMIITAFLAVGLCASEGRWITAEVTAYAGNCPICETTGVTANGTETDERPYGVAASPDIKFGWRVFIPVGAGYLDQSKVASLDRWFDVDDRGGALRTEWKRSGITRLDLRYRTHASAKAFGRKLMLVYIATD